MKHSENDLWVFMIRRKKNELGKLMLLNWMEDGSIQRVVGNENSDGKLLI